ncbi:MAG: patatin-like phospholipase family protein [Planctomycetes bacterium]|nr:patatin-like phospholipase family protein [Planctomycetota bacterium]
MNRALLRHIEEEERREIWLRRAVQMGDRSEEPRDENLLGLSLSGGGIRSATFNLGVIQALADYRLLRRIDYLSTVSGGGYIGSWLSACVRRAHSIDEVETRISPARRGYEHGPESRQITHLRSYSNYLTPKLGLFSLDSWTLIAIYLRNVLVNQALVLAPVVMLLCLLRAGVQGTYELIIHAASESSTALLWAARAAAAALTAAWLLEALYRLHQLESGEPGAQATAYANTRPRLLVWLVPAALLAPIALGVWSSQRHLPLFDAFEPTREFSRGSLLAFVATGAMIFAGTRLAVAAGGRIARSRQRFRQFVQRVLGPAAVRRSVPLQTVFGEVLLSLISGALGGGALYVSLSLFLWRLRTPSSWLHQIVTTGWTTSPGSQAVAEAIAMVTFGPPVYLLSLLLASFLEVWLRGSWIRKFSMSEEQREWWSRANAWLLFLAGLWLALSVVVFYLPAAIEHLARSYAPSVTFATVLGWVGTVAAGIWAGQSGATGAGKRTGKELMARLAPPIFLIGLFALSATAVAGAIIPDGAHVHHPTVQFESLAAQALDPNAGRRFLQLICVAGGLFGLLTLVDANIFSLNSLYANRLTRCYLGASYRNRFDEVVAAPLRARWNEFTGFDPDDDVRFDDLRAPEIPPGEHRAWRQFLSRAAPASPLGPDKVAKLQAELRLLRLALIAAAEAGELAKILDDGGSSVASGSSTAPARLNAAVQLLREKGCDSSTIADLINIELRALIPQGPLLVINTALNIAAGDRLEWQERKADSFFLTPLYSGSDTTGFRKMPKNLTEFTLGRAVAVSGSAVNPNMGYHTTPAVAALLTVFNVRLGWWMHNPRASDRSIIDWCESKLYGYWTQRFAPRWNPEKGPAGQRILRELAGLTNEKSRFVQLSDGGHFENLGVFELIRRRCRYVIACDAGADPNYEFFDLASAVRKCREDLGVPIDIDVSSLRPTADGASKRHVAVGEIRYDVASPDVLPGMLIYIKASVTGDEPADVLNYKRQDDLFPHQSTLDQFFNESQFESYRALGYHTAQEVFRDFRNFSG